MAIRDFFNPSNSIAIAAVCIALTGTATAAVVVTGEDVKNETLTSADIKDASVRGADIRNGSIEVRDLSKAATTYLKGQTGPAGATGPAGPKGDPGRSALTVLQSGETIVGGFNIDTHADSSGSDYRTWVPFPIPAPAVPSVVVANLDPATCTGTVDAPTAPAGKVCVYEGGSGNADLYAINGRATTEPNPSIRVGAAAARRGFIVDLTAQSSGDAFVVGSWAYTAP